jgi:pimeloyl-ACP methyl ester carboxylesterase
VIYSGEVRKWLRTAAIATSVLALSLVAAPAPAQAAPALTWSPCSYPSGALCTSIVVPKDWGNPSASGTYRISIARIPARNPQRRIGVLMFNPGGPGSAAISNLPWVQSLLPAVVRDRFDIVAVDPRGVGRSQPSMRSCSAPQPAPPATGPIDWLSWSQTFMNANRRANRACLKLNREHADFVGTWQIVHDLDAVRAAMNERSITFWGMSYGTTIGRAYAQAFTNRVRALLLDATISPVSSIESWAEEHTYDDELAITTMLTALGGRYTSDHARVMRALESRSVRAPNGSSIDRWRVGRALVAWSSFHTTWGSAASLITAVRDALFATSRSQRAAAATRAASILGTTSATGQSGTLSPQWTYVNCSDFTDRPTSRTLARLAEEGARTGGAGIGMAVLREGAQCAGLPKLGRALTPMTRPLTMRVPPIIANAKADNRTPWTAALQTQEAFAGSRIVGYAGTHHILYGRRTACVNDPITRYLLRRTLPDRDIVCPM